MLLLSFLFAYLCNSVTISHGKTEIWRQDGWMGNLKSQCLRGKIDSLFTRMDITGQKKRQCSKEKVIVACHANDVVCSQ